MLVSADRRPSCREPGLVWLTEAEERDYKTGERVFIVAWMSCFVALKLFSTPFMSTWHRTNLSEQR